MYKMHIYLISISPKMVLLVPSQLEEVSKFLMPGQYNNMIWFYQESEETPDVSLVEDDVNEDKVSEWER